MAVNFDRLPSDEAAMHEAAVYGRLIRCDQIRNVLDALNWYRCNEAMAEERLAKAETDLAVARSWTDSAAPQDRPRRPQDALAGWLGHHPSRRPLLAAGGLPRAAVSRITGTLL